MNASQKNRIQLLLFVTLFVCVFSYILFSEKHGAAKINDVVQEIVADCKHTSGDRAQCYETEVPSLYPSFSVDELFTVIRGIRAEDSTYQFCHVLAHKIGERVVAEDPSKWVEAIPFNPSDGMCSNGYIHGVTVGRFKSEVLNDKILEENVPDFARACEPRKNWKPTPLDQAICYHGMGHLFDFITDADIPKGLSLCERIGVSATGNFRRVCIEGIFMQIYQPLEPDDFALIARMKYKPTKETVRAYCSIYTNPEYEGACLRESWPYFEEEIIDGTGSTAFCSGQPNVEETGKCYDSISAIVGRMSLGNQNQAISACSNFPSEYQLQCYVASAQAALEEDRTTASKAFALCKQAPGALSESCSSTIISRAGFIFGYNTKEYSDFCSIARQEAQQQCASGQ